MLKTVRLPCLCLCLLVVLGIKPGMARTSMGRTADELAHPLGWEDGDSQGPEKTPAPGKKTKASAGTVSEPAQPAGAARETAAPEPDGLTAELQELIHHLGGEPHQRQRAIERLVIIGQPAVKPLQAALTDDYKFTRIGALGALGYLRALEVLDDVKRLLQDSEYEVRAEALMTLGKMKAQSATAAVISARSDRHPRVRRAAVMALARLKNDQACGAVIAALADPVADVRRQAAQELSAFSESRVVGALLKATRDPDVETRAYAARSLGEVGDPAAIPRLRELTASRFRFVREEAAAALQNLSENERK